MEPPLSDMPELSDEKRVSRLFAPLPPSRETNPPRWDAHMKFWRKALVALCFSNGDILSRPKDAIKFKSLGMVPQNMDRVMEELAGVGVLSPTEDSLMRRIWSTLSPNSQQQEKWLNKDAIKAYAIAVIVWNRDLVEKGESFDGDVHAVSTLVDVELHPQFDEISGSCTLRSSVWDAVIDEIQRMGKGVMIIDGESKGVKFSTETKITKGDCALLQLKSTLHSLHVDQRRLEGRAEECRIAALNAVKDKRDIARVLVKRRKMLLEAAHKRVESIHTLENVLIGVETAQTQARVHSAMVAGKEAMEEIIPRMEDIHETLGDVRDIMADLDQISIGSELDLDESLEDELAQLVVDDGAQSMMEKLSILDTPPTQAPVVTVTSTKPRLLA